MGISTTRECPVETEDWIGSIDLVAWGEKIVAIEIERSNRRVENDITKAAALPADELLIVVPNSQVRRLVRKRIQQLKPKKNIGIYVACLPEALTRLTHYFPM